MCRLVKWASGTGQEAADSPRAVKWFRICQQGHTLVTELWTWGGLTWFLVWALSRTSRVVQPRRASVAVKFDCTAHLDGCCFFKKLFPFQFGSTNVPQTVVKRLGTPNELRSSAEQHAGEARQS